MAGTHQEINLRLYPVEMKVTKKHFSKCLLLVNILIYRSESDFVSLATCHLKQWHILWQKLGHVDIHQGSQQQHVLILVWVLKP